MRMGGGGGGGFFGNIDCNLIPRVLRFFGQQLVARRDSGEFEKKSKFLDWLLLNGLHCFTTEILR